MHEDVEAFRKDNSDDIRSLEVDLCNHLRNVCLGSMTKALSTLLGNTMREELDEINLRLRVSTSIKLVLWVVNKEFIICANYPQGHGELFREFVYTYHYISLLLRVER